jgi:dual oxidase
MLLVHGSSAILKQPILGWWLLLPLLLVVTEKLYRFYRGFIPLEATVQLAEDNMVALSIKVRNKLSRFRPGQYIYLQIPSISVFQWHPFTVSKITQDSIVIHIRTSAGNWTSSLTSTIDQTEGDQDGIKRFKVAMEGPYGSPSREFYRYNDTIIFGAGIGITPFSAILFDLFDKLNDKKSPWIDDAKNVQRQQKHHKKVNLSDTSTSSQGISIADAAVEQGRVNSSSDDQLLRAILEKRSISLHWTVKTSQDLQWLSLLLNQLSSNLSVKINIHLYVTQSDKDQSISTLIYRSLLDHHRVASIEQKTSVLTGLIQTCHFARPDLEAILDDYHRAYCSMEIHQRLRKVGVIYCGPISIGRVLSRKCQYLTSQARAESARLRYYYHSESF